MIAVKHLCFLPEGYIVNVISSKLVFTFPSGKIYLALNTSMDDESKLECTERTLFIYHGPLIANVLMLQQDGDGPDYDNDSLTTKSGRTELVVGLAYDRIVLIS